MDDADRSASFAAEEHFGGRLVSPPHVELMCVGIRATLDAAEHEDAFALCAVMPEPPASSTCGRRRPDAPIETNVAHKIVKMARHRRSRWALPFRRGAMIDAIAEARSSCRPVLRKSDPSAQRSRSEYDDCRTDGRAGRQRRRRSTAFWAARLRLLMQKCQLHRSCLLDSAVQSASGRDQSPRLTRLRRGRGVKKI